jgi:hypothetical protein
MLALGYLAAGSNTGDTDSDDLRRQQIRMPVAHPPLEPDRPDLISEPRIEEPG